MVQPINYTTQVTNPFKAALEGFQFGVGIQNIRAQQQATQLQMRQQQQAMMVAQEAEKERAAFFANPNPTMRDAARLASVLPKDRADALRPYIESMTKEQQQSTLSFGLQVLNALTTNPAVGVKMLRDRAEAERNGGRADQADAYDRFADSAERQGPASSFKIIAEMIGHLPGAKEALENVASASGGKEGYEVLTPQQVMDLGLPRGTYQRNTKNQKIEVLGSGGESYEILSRAEASKLGLPSGTYQRSTSGRITAVGPGGVTVNMPPQIGSIPQDYRVIYDAQNRPVSMEVIPGTKTHRELQEKEATGAAAAQTAITKSDIVLDEVKSLRNLIKNQTVADPVTGTLGAIVGEKGGVLAAGSARRTAEATISAITANIGFDRLQQMRAESPTGGALGNVSNIELGQLQSVLGSIDLNQKDEALLAKLTRLEQLYTNIIRKAEAYPNAEKYGFGKRKEPESVRVGNKTYTRPDGFTDEQWNAYKQAVGAK